MERTYLSLARENCESSSIDMGREPRDDATMRPEGKGTNREIDARNGSISRPPRPLSPRRGAGGRGRSMHPTWMMARDEKEIIPTIQE